MVQPSAHTEWTLSFIKLLEAILCLVCMIKHIQAVLYDEEPMPHNVLFCATFGGFFFLCLAGSFVPMSGQWSPPGVDFVFCISASGVFFVAACIAMYYVVWDPHLRYTTDKEESEHPFFLFCKEHAIWSMITGTMFLMHAVISADRLYFMKRGHSTEDEERSITEVDLSPDAKIQLHIFLMDWVIILWNTKCCKCIQKNFIRLSNCCVKCFNRVKPKKKRRRRKRRRHTIDTSTHSFFPQPSGSPLRHPTLDNSLSMEEIGSSSKSPKKRKIGNIPVPTISFKLPEAATSKQSSQNRNQAQENNENKTSKKRWNFLKL